MHPFSSALPAALSRRTQGRFYYGWVVLAVAFATMFATGPGQTYTVSILINPLIEQFGMSRTAVSTAYALATVTAALGLPYMGRLIDRLGQRAMILLIYFCLGLVCFAFPLVAGPVTLFVGFTGLRYFGQGSGMLITFNVVSQWFVKRRGLAMTVIMVGAAAASAIYPPGLQLLVTQFGWRSGYVLLGASVWALILLPTWLLVADRPETLGLVPDGGPTPARAGAASTGPAVPPDEVHWTLREATHSVAFWLIALAMAVPSALLTGMMFHQISYFQLQGLAPETAAGIFTVFSAAMLGTTLLFGPLLDRLPTRYMITVGLFALPVTLWFMLVADTPGLAVVYGVLLGVCAGTYFPASNYVWPHYFGRRHLGSIQGVANTINILGTAVGPVPFGVAFDLFGGYREAILAQSLVPLVMGIVLLLVPPPRKAAAGAPEPAGD